MTSNYYNIKILFINYYIDFYNYAKQHNDNNNNNLLNIIMDIYKHNIKLINELEECINKDSNFILMKHKFYEVLFWNFKDIIKNIDNMNFNKFYLHP